MTLPFSINGANAVIPAVYDSFRVDDSLLGPANTGKSALILGEATEGLPGNLLDLQGSFFTGYEDVKDFYKSGPIVDAARQIFSSQPSGAFNGSIDRLYIYKTNASTAASKALQSNYGSIVASRYGESGNAIKCQITDAQTETLPTVSFYYLPQPTATTFSVAVNGGAASSVAVGTLDLAAPTGTAAELVTNLAGVSGLSATGGTARTMLASGATLNFSFATPTAGTLAITISSGGNWQTSAAGAQAGDLCVIPAGGALSGTSDANAGCYVVQSCTTTVLTLVRLSALGASTAANVTAFDLTAASSVSAANVNAGIGAWDKVTVTQTAEPVAGAAASLEIMAASAGLNGCAAFYQPASLQSTLSSSASTIATISASVPSSNHLTISLSGASFSVTPPAGDAVWIDQTSPLAGTTLKNVGPYIVLSASYNSMVLQSAYGLTTEAVSSVALNGNTAPVKVQPGFMTTTVAAHRLTSAAERKVSVVASRTTDGAQFPATAIGGRVALELSYYDGVATAAVCSIDQNAKMTLHFTGSGVPADISIHINKYATLGDLAAYLNTISGLSARVATASMNSDKPTVLDMVTSAPILAESSLPSYVGRLKRDYSDFVTFFNNNFGFVSFKAGTLTLKVGLPTADASAGFLAGGTVGATAMADIQAGLDAGLKVDVRVVAPLFSRDANKDYDDGLTDSSSSYTVLSVHAALLAHVSTASSTLYRRERFGCASIMDTFTKSKDAASAVAFERMQMAFQMVRATGVDGNLQWFQPWMAACALTAGRVQAVAGQPMLRKAFLMTATKHIGDKSLFDETLLLDFDPEDQGKLSDAIQAGLLVWNAVRGKGVLLVSQDLTTRSRVADPKGWVYERASVLFACDEARQGLREAIENIIGADSAFVDEKDVRRTAETVLKGYVTEGVLIKWEITKITKIGNGFLVKVSLFPPEAIEFVGIDVTAKRNVEAA